MMLALLLACADDPKVADTAPAEDTGEEAAASLSPGLHSLDSLDWGAPEADLAPLDAMVAGAQVVALGESVHFSGGYHEARARLIPYLVESLGFRAVAFEGPWLTAEDSRPYVERCEGSLEDAMAGLYFSVWMSESQAQVMDWLCDWNAAHPDDPVRFWGFDVQEPWRDGPWLRALLSEVDADGTAALVEGVSGCFGAGFDSSTELYADELAYGVLTGTHSWPEERSARCAEALPQISAWLDDNADAVAAARSAEDLALARVAVTAISFAHDEYTLGIQDVGSWDARDEGMFEVFQALWALRAPASRVVIFAHNAHIVADGESIQGSVYPAGWKDMGSHLRDALGDSYAPFGFVAHEVRYNWPGYDTVTSTARGSSVETRLQSTEAPLLLVDLEAATADGSTLAAGDAAPLGHPGTGTMAPEAHYRGLLYQDASPEMVFWGRRSARDPLADLVLARSRR